MTQTLQPTTAFRAADYPAHWVSFILIASVCYLAVLSFLNARGFHVSPSLVASVEFLLYMACLSVLIRRLPLLTVAFSFALFSWLVLTWLVRQSPDLKGLRDLIIPILFLSLGRHVADVAFADRQLKVIVGILVVLGLFEALLTTTYSQLFNTFSFYVNLGGIRESAAMFEGQLLTLNGFRPEGIGRTILPFLLGPHRTSSAMMEPVSLGNFGVILLAWGLSKPWAEIRRFPAWILSAALLIALSDSRFGLTLSFVLIGARVLPLPMLRKLAPFIPFLVLAAVLGLAFFWPSTGDHLHGRISLSGHALLNFDGRMLLGLQGPLPNFGDMGFAYVISRFGTPLCLVLILAMFTLPMADLRGERFRVLIVLYIFANLAVSGTSVFALKTAGLMWFLFGVLSAARPLKDTMPQAQASNRAPSLQAMRART
jgi:putative polymerase